MSRIPALFVSHGSPMIAFQLPHEHDGEAADPYARALAEFGQRTLSGARAIVVMSAHWHVAGPVLISTATRNRIQHDFAGFPRDLYDLTYDCPGSPSISAEIRDLLAGAGIDAELAAGHPLDHGAWIPLRFICPQADLPVIQISIPMQYEPREVLKLGRALSELRENGVLLIGSGGAVHNLEKIQWHGRQGPPLAAAQQFNDWVKANLQTAQIETLLGFEDEAPEVRDAHPSNEHFLPIFFTVGSSLKGDRPQILHDEIQYGSLSMLVFEMTGLSPDVNGPLH